MGNNNKFGKNSWKVKLASIESLDLQFMQVIRKTMIYIVKTQDHHK